MCYYNIFIKYIYEIKVKFDILFYYRLLLYDNLKKLMESIFSNKIRNNKFI